MFSRFAKRHSVALGVLGLAVVVLIVAQPSPAYADFEGSLRSMKDQLAGVVLPLLSVIGLLVASFSYLTGNPEAKRHIIYALIGAGVGFGAQSIIDFLSSSIH
jgi:type IV secretory pathway VirB2 component (pilin)